jgi:uroporphyrinogen-III synthase
MNPSFNGLRVLSLESRRAPEMARLIETFGGRPLVAPSMREVPIESNSSARESAEAVVRGEFDLIVLLTGVGTRAWLDVVSTAGLRDQFVARLRQMKVAVRGPKPAAVMRELEAPVWVTAPEPNTWRELLAAIDSRQDDFPLAGRRIALQEYGEANNELIDGLEARGGQVTRVAVYRWALPEDVGPLRDAIRAVAAGDIDVAMFTTATQVVHLLQVAREMGLEDAVRDGLRRMVIASIGPTTSDELREQGIEVNMEPSHPKMGILVREAAERASELRRRL